MKKPKPRKTKPATKKVSFIPKGYHSVTPYLACGDGAQAIDFYAKAFGAVEVLRMPGPDGKVAHAEVRIGDSHVMLTGEYAAMDFLSPKSRGGTSVHLHVYVKDADAMIARAVAAGATLVSEAKDQFYGDRMGTVEDPFGHVWHLATHIEDLSKAEMRKRGEKAMEANK
jgi:PhnB protein